jgi:ABC-2 type transport system ATP-binding protein
VLGLSGVDLEIPASGVIGLLGPNGAGKSTMIGLISGLLNPSNGSVEVFGVPLPAPAHIRARVGLCPEGDPFFPRMTCREFLFYMGQLSGLTSATARRRTGELLDELGLSSFAHREPGKMSKGERQRVKLAQALIHEPDLLLLDEPLSGMDPLIRLEVTDMIRRLGGRGKTLLVSSHILSEVEAMTSTVVVVNVGRVIASGTVASIREMLYRFPHKIRIDCARAAPLAKELLDAPGIVGMELGEEGTVVVRTTEPDSFYPFLNELVARTKPGVRSFHAEDQDLASVFQYLVPEG